MRRSYSYSFKGGVRRFGAVIASAALIGGGAVGIVAARAGADTAASNFDSFAAGSVNAQGGWTSTGPYDQGIVNNSAFPGAPASFGAKSLRISDAVTSGNFADQTYSKPTANQAGEPGSLSGGYPVGTLQNTFISSFNFASATPSVEQPGLHMSVSPDRGDGARMSYVRIEDSPSGFNIYFDPYVDAAPLATPGDLDNGCGAEDGFPDILAASDVSRGAHNLEFVMKFNPGPHNDVVTVLLDGTPIAIGPSWEDYYRDCAEQQGGDGGANANLSRTTRNLEFRESGTADPGNAGQGFLIDGVQSTAISLPGAPTHVSGVPGKKSVLLSWAAPGALAGNALTGYVVTPYIGSTAQPAQSFDASTTTRSITGLKNGTTYSFKVAATNALGTGAQSVTSGFIVAGAPGRPGNVKVTSPSSGKLKVTFKAPGNNGAKITAYTAICSSPNGGSTVTKTGSKSPIGLAVSAGKKYTCTVVARNSRGAGPKSVATPLVNS